MPKPPATTQSDATEIRIGRILDEVLARRKRGLPVDHDQLLRNHADIAEELRSHLAFLRTVQPQGDLVAELLERGWLMPASDSRYRAAFGPYRIESQRGQGGMGVVFRALHVPDDKPVALKLLQPEYARDLRAVQRFQREAQLAAGLSHENIVATHDVGEHDGVPYLAMTYIDGPDLAAVLRRYGVLPSEIARIVLTHLLRGLRAAHGADLIHRDIKPSNLLLSGWPWAAQTEDKSPAAPEAVDRDLLQLKIADFGLARMLAPHTRVTTSHGVLGTAEYMSPEQARGSDEIDARSDLFSAGVVLYEMLTGQSPFKAETPTATLYRIVHEPPPRPRTIAPEVDPHLSAFALALMEKRPDDRPRSADACLDELRSPRHAANRFRGLWNRPRARVAAVLTAAIVASAVWTLSGPRGGSTPGAQAAPVWRAARISPGDPRQIEVRYANSQDWTRITWLNLPPQCRAHSVELVRPNTSGPPLLVVSTERAMNDGGHVLGAFDIHQNLQWSRALRPEPFSFTWPDMQRPLDGWSGAYLAHGNLDQDPADEVISLSSCFEYLSQAMVIDGGNGRGQGRFLNLGHISHMVIVEDGFVPGRPAIVVAGVNNKLDGFNQPQPDDPPRRTRWDIVPVVAVLDPQQMNGISPPYTKRIPLTGRPWAYAYLDAPTDPMATRADGSRYYHELPNTRYASIRVIKLANDRRFTSGFRGFTVEFISNQPYTPTAKATRCTLLLDLDLTLRDAMISGTEVHRTTVDQWREVWHPIVQRGEPVDDPRPTSAQP